MKDKRPLWISLLSVVIIAVVSLAATLASGWAPKLGLDLAGGLSVVYETHTPVTQAELDTITTILNERVGTGSSGATVSSQGSARCPDGKHTCALIGASIPGQKNTEAILAQLGKTAQLFFRPALCYAVPHQLVKGQLSATGTLPTCSTASALTAANLAVNTGTGQATGNPQPDAQFAPFVSTTPPPADDPDGTDASGADGPPLI